jgi:hypothetical protein
MAPRSIHCVSSFHLDLEPEVAVELFTPEGERAWVDGWDPHYPDPDDNPDAFGTVFLTHHHGEHATVWVVGPSDERARRYSRFEPGGKAGSIEVRCTPEEGGTTVEVEYRLTALSAVAEAELEAFERGFSHYIYGWCEAIQAAIAAGAITRAGP